MELVHQVDHDLMIDAISKLFIADILLLHSIYNSFEIYEEKELSCIYFNITCLTYRKCNT